MLADVAPVVDWSRAQFAMTAAYHWLFVPLTLGLGVICAIMETIYYRTGNPFWKTTAKFWMKLFGINFAIGVATGIILEFQFGTNWSNYSYFVGDIFGAPLAIEGIFAFFLEATFFAVMFFGWNKVSRGFHLASTWLTAIGAGLSALWILVANAWMQRPVGTWFNIATMRNEMNDFWAVLFSPVAINKFFHAMTSGFVLGAVFVVGVSAWFLLKKRESEFAKKSIRVASVFGFVSVILLATTGDRSGVLVAKHQPMKLAALEGLYEGKSGAGLVAIGAVNPEKNVDNNAEPYLFKLEIPKLLSLMGYHDFNAFVPGINDLVYGNPSQGLLPTQEKIERGRAAIAQLTRYKEAKDDGDTAVMRQVEALFDPATPQGRSFLDNYFAYFGYGYLNSPADIVPNVWLLFYSFRIMVGMGFFLIVLLGLVAWLSWKNKLDVRRWRWLLYVCLWAIPFTYLASQAGWVVAEVGRQPWTIQDLLPTVASVSSVNAAAVQVTFYLFLALFTVLLIAELRIMIRQVKLGPKAEEKKN